MCGLNGSLCSPHKRLVLGIVYACLISETLNLVKGLICTSSTETCVQFTKSPVVAELNDPLLHYLQVLRDVVRYPECEFA